MRTKNLFLITMGLIVFLMSACQNSSRLEMSTDAEKHSIKVVENAATTAAAETLQENKSEEQPKEVYYNTYDVVMEVNPYTRKIHGLESVTYKNTTGKALKYVYFHM